MDISVQSVMDFISNVLDPISIVISIITFFPVVVIWYQVSLGRKRRHSQWFTEVRQQVGDRPSILVVDLHPSVDVGTTVERYRQNTEGLRDIPDNRIFRLTRQNWLKPEDMPAFTRELSDVAAEIIRAGTSTLHLFYAGPVIPPALIGAQFFNTCRVQLYQFDSHRGDYVNWGPLRHSQYL